MATIQEVNNFIATIAPIAQKQAEVHHNKIYASVCIAQACCESAYGTSPKMKNANAVFGIKVGSSKYRFRTAWKGKAYSTKTKECYDGRTYTEITDMFRAYDSLDESVEDYFDMLCTSSRYKNAWNQSTPRKCIEGIKNGGYATSPTYVSTIMSIINKYGLTKYDAVGDNKPADEPFIYTVGEHQVLANVLNIRKSSSSNANDIGDLVKDSVVPIDMINGNWGHFEGWINLKYTKKI